MTQLVTVATFDTPIDAAIARNKLESVGVRAMLADEATVQMAPYLGPAMGGVKLQVLDDDVERALSVLEGDTASARDDAVEAARSNQANDEHVEERDGADSIRSWQRLAGILCVIYLGVILVAFLLLVVADMVAG